MFRILFVCHGNICRSPMAEFILKDLVNKKGRQDSFVISSAAVSREEIGNPVYPPARRKLQEHGLSCEGKTARQMLRQDYDRYDLLIGMDSGNIRGMQRICSDGSMCNTLSICGGDSMRSKLPICGDGSNGGKIRRLLDFTDHPRDIADPWYTGDFDAAWTDIEEGCKALLQTLQ
jgi:protein-tyrosine phosphatase